MQTKIQTKTLKLKNDLNGIINKLVNEWGYKIKKAEDKDNLLEITRKFPGMSWYDQPVGYIRLNKDNSYLELTDPGVGPSLALKEYIIN